MPEIVELEIMKENLERKVLDKKVVSAKVFAPKILQNISASNVEKSLRNQVLKKITRRGKHLIFNFPNELRMIIHLMLNANMTWEKVDDEITPRTVFSLDFNNKIRLAFKDWSRWMKVWFFTKDNGSTEDLPFIKNLGVEPLSKDFTIKIFKEICRKSRTGNIKAVLMDQKKIAGIGNAYADETLFAAKINPNRVASKLNDEELETIFNEIRKTINRGLKNVRKLARANDFDIQEQERSWMNVYRKDGQPCPVCKGEIVKERLNQRDAFYCRRCQKQVVHF